jgi:photosystem II stability/assembly factor-like uncharacterized protein
MKKIAFLAAIILTSNFLLAQWVQLEQFTSNALKSVFFTDAYKGYVAGDNGTIAKTYDGGLNWEVQTVGQDINIYALYFPSTTTGYALGRIGNMVHDPCVFLKTTDEGMNWAINVIDSSYSLTDVYFMSEDTGFICGYHNPGGVTKGLILKTTNGGNDWSTMHEGYGFLNSLHFPSLDMGYAMGYTASHTQPFWIMQKTVDGGETWNTSYGPPYSKFQVSSVYFTNENIGYSVGEGTLLRTTDGGDNWIDQDINPPPECYLFAVSFTNPNKGYIAAMHSEGGCVFQTLDGGENWMYENLGGNGLYSLHFPGLDTGYAVGYSGNVFKTTNGGNPSGTNETVQNNTNLIILPNPLSSNSILKYNLGSATPVTIQIFDMKGQLLQTLIERKKQQGTQRVLFNGSYLKPGVYFCKLQTDSKVLTKKFIIE